MLRISFDKGIRTNAMSLNISSSLSDKKRTPNVMDKLKDVVLG